MVWASQVSYTWIWDYERRDGAKPCNHRSRFIESSDMSVAGSENSVSYRESWQILDCEEKLRYCLIETTATEKRTTDHPERSTKGGSWAEA